MRKNAGRRWLRYSTVFLLLISVSLLPCDRSIADIIPPDKPSGASREQAIPESLNVELDPEVAIKLRPAIVAFLTDRNKESLKKAFLELAGQTDTLPTFDVFLAKLFAAYNQFGEALSILELYTNDNVEDPEAFVTLASIAVASGRVVDAWLHLLYAQRLLDRNKLPAGRKSYVLPMIVELRASVAERRKQWAEAEQLFRKLQELKPDTAYPLWRAGRVEVLSGDVQAGFETLQQAHKNDSGLPHPSLVVAQTLHDNSDWQSNPKSSARLESWFKKSISDTKDAPSAWASYLKWLVLANRPEEVASHFDQLDDKIKLNREVGLVRSFAARYLGDNATAERILSALHDANIEDIEVADQLALVLVESSEAPDQARAVQLAESNFGRAGQWETALATAAWVQFRTGANEKAKQLFSQLASRGNLTPQTAYYMAEFMEKNGQQDEALRLLRLAVDAPGFFVQRAQVKKRLSGE